MAHILMVDDNPSNQRYIERIIRHRTQHELAFAADSKAAIERIVEKRPDLIFLDLFIPGTDGFEFFKVLRGHPATASIPIVIHTAVPLDQVTQIRMRRVACDAFVEFPVEASELVRIMDTAMQRTAVPIRRWTPPGL